MFKYVGVRCYDDLLLLKDNLFVMEFFKYVGEVFYV